MRKIHFFVFNMVLAIALTIVGFCCFNNNETAIASQEPSIQAETTTEETLPILNYLSVSQENQVFTQDDFVKAKIPGGTIEYDTIYTNKSVSLGLINQNTYTQHHFFVNQEDKTNSYHEINGSKFYVLDISTITEDSYFLVSIQIFKAININPITYSMLIIQTTDNFQINDNLYWEYTYKGKTEIVKAPTNNVSYTPIKLHIPNGTELNPTYVKFSFLGQDYLVYNKNGNFYNNYDNQKINIDSLYFDKSGTYEIEVYDKTHLCQKDGNYNKFSFAVKNDQTKYASFYLHAVDNTGLTITDGQIVNNDIIVNFVNLNDIISDIDRVVVTKAWNTGGENQSLENVYKDNIPSSVTLTEDGHYSIEVINKSGNTIYEFYLILIKDIKTYFEKDGVEYEVGKNEPANITKTFSIPTTINSSYGNIFGETTYKFNVTVAKSEPSINGINNKARTQNSVSLVVKGVGNIDVSVTQDGKTSNLVLQNNGKIQTFSEPGKYFIKITDQMGTTVTKSFTITVKMNAASVVLLVIAAVIIVVFMIMIIVSRTKIKVR